MRRTLDEGMLVVVQVKKAYDPALRTELSLTFDYDVSVLDYLPPLALCWTIFIHKSMHGPAESSELKHGVHCKGDPRPTVRSNARGVTPPMLPVLRARRGHGTAASI